MLLFTPLTLDGIIFFPILIHRYFRLSAPLASHVSMTFEPTATNLSSGFVVISANYDNGYVRSVATIVSCYVQCMTINK